MNKSKTIKHNCTTKESVEYFYPLSEDFECNPKGECWCKEEVDEQGKSTFPTIPYSYDKTQCLSPEAIEQLRVEQDLVDEMENPNV